MTATLIQNGKIERFPLIAMGVEYWRHLENMRNAAIEAGTISEAERALYTRTDDIEEAIRLLAAARGK